MIKGNVFDALNRKEVAVMHCCNNRHTMGSGIAMTVRRDYPEAYLAYLESTSNLGTISHANSIINAVAQNGYGSDGKRYINYEALVACCLEVNDLAYDTIAVPYLFGSDRAGGDWNIVKAILENTLHAQLEIYTLV